MSKPKTSNRDYGYQPNMANGIVDMESQVTTAGMAMSGKVEKHSEFMNPNEQSYDEMEYLYPTYNPLPPIEWPTPTTPVWPTPTTPVWPGMPTYPEPPTPEPPPVINYVRDVIPGCITKHNLIPYGGTVKMTNDMAVKYPHGNWSATAMYRGTSTYWKAADLSTPIDEPYHMVVLPGGYNSGCSLVFPDPAYPIIPTTGPFSLSIVFMLKEPLLFHQHYDSNGEYIYDRINLPKSDLTFSHGGMTSMLFGTWPTGYLASTYPEWWAQPSDEPYVGQTAYPGPDGYSFMNPEHEAQLWEVGRIFYLGEAVSWGEDNYVCTADFSLGDTPPGVDWRLCDAEHYGVKSNGSLSAMGLYLYNGNQIMGCRRIQNDPTQDQGIITPPLSCNVYYHVAFSCESSGRISMLLTERGGFGVLRTGMQLPTSNAITPLANSYVGIGYLKYSIGTEPNFELSDIHDSPNCIIAKPRVYQRALSTIEMEGLSKEAFRQTYITERYYAY